MSPRRARSSTLLTSDPRPIALALRARREWLGWSQQRLAEQAGITQPTVSQIESGKVRNPPPDTLDKLAGAMGCAVVSTLHVIREDTPRA